MKFLCACRKYDNSKELSAASTADIKISQDSGNNRSFYLQTTEVTWPRLGVSLLTQFKIDHVSLHWCYSASCSDNGRWDTIIKRNRLLFIHASENFSLISGDYCFVSILSPVHHGGSTYDSKLFALWTHWGLRGTSFLHSSQWAESHPLEVHSTP